MVQHMTENYGPVSITEHEAKILHIAASADHLPTAIALEAIRIMARMLVSNAVIRELELNQD